MGLGAIGVVLFVASACGEEDQPPPFDSADESGGSGGGGDTDTGGDAGASAGGNAGAPQDGSGAASSSGGEGTGATDGTGGEAPLPPGVPCGDTVCAFHAACEMEDEEPTCECAPGFGGVHCLDIDECAEQPDRCGFDGSCVNFAASFACYCDPGYIESGSGCEDVSECGADPCAEGADCAEADGGYACTCGSGTYGNGHYCQADDTCAGDPCGGNGTCVVTSDGPVCQCAIGFSGASTCTACGADLAVTDDVVRATINELLGAEPDAAIPVSALEGHTELDLAFSGVTSLAGLECWPHLQRIDVFGNEELTDIDVLGSLNALVRVDLGCTGVESLTPLTGHPTLQILEDDASGCGTPLASVDPVSSL